MLCGCIPIGSNVAAIPFIINDTGYILMKRDIEDLVKVLHIAIEDRSKTGFKARKRIQTSFTIHKRKNKLLQLIGDPSKLLNQTKSL
jgi:glycosyltransferase involved in cell wall biosynthesis